MADSCPICEKKRYRAIKDPMSNSVDRSVLAVIIKHPDINQEDIRCVIGNAGYYSVFTSEVINDSINRLISEGFIEEHPPEMK